MNIWGLALRTNLPATWLRQEADAGRIPCLRIADKMRFNTEAVENALAERAAAEAAARIWRKTGPDHD